MRNTIVKLHGTSGSGKSTVAHNFLAAAVEVQPILSVRGKVEAYKTIQPHRDVPLFIVGPYKTQCGGLDAIGDVDDQIRLVEQCAECGNVFYEGLLASTYYGRLGAMSEQFGDRHIFAFLDTPMDVCLQRIRERRLEVGNDKPLNEDNTRKRQRSIDALQAKLRRQGRDVRVISYIQATEQVRGLYGS
jgi:cytidylate kinase